MFPKAHFTSYSKMSGSRYDHTFVVIWVMKIFFFFFFLYSSSVHSCHLFLISSASVRSIPFLFFYCAHLCMKYSLGISNFIEVISSPSHSVVFLYFFALITEEGFFISPCYSLELCIQMGIFFLFSFVFNFSSFLSYLLGLLRQQFSFFAFLFLGDGLDPCLLFNVMHLHPWFIRHSVYQI